VAIGDLRVRWEQVVPEKGNSTTALGTIAPSTWIIGTKLLEPKSSTDVSVPHTELSASARDTPSHLPWQGTVRPRPTRETNRETNSFGGVRDQLLNPRICPLTRAYAYIQTIGSQWQAYI
jgi:endo-beta-N-acetylglucosaminidase D